MLCPATSSDHPGYPPCLTPVSLYSFSYFATHLNSSVPSLELQVEGKKGKEKGRKSWNACVQVDI